MAGRRKFLFNLNSVEAFCRNFKIIAGRNLTVQALEVRDRELEKKWANVVDSYETLIFESAKENGDLVFDDANTLKYDEAYSLYEECKSSILLSIQQQNIADSSGNAPIMVQNQVHSLKLPPCDTQTFEGDTLNGRHLETYLWQSLGDILNSHQRRNFSTF